MNPVKNIVEIAKQSKEVQDQINKHMESVNEQVEFIKKKISAGSRIEYNIILLEKHIKKVGLYERGLYEFNNVDNSNEYFQSDLVLDKIADVMPEEALIIMDVSINNHSFEHGLLDVPFITEIKVNKSQYEEVDKSHPRISEEYWNHVDGYGLIFLK